MRDNLLSSDITEGELRKSYWYVTHILVLKKKAKLIGIIFVSSIWIYVITSLLFITIGQFETYPAIIQELKARVIQQPPGLLVQNLGIFPPGAVSRQTADALLYNLYAEVENQNVSYRADFDGVFIINGREQRPVRGFLLPGEKKFVFLFSIREDPVVSLFEMRNIRFSRISTRQLKNIKSKMNFDIGDNVPITLSGDIKTSSFTFSNLTGYTYREIPLQIVLKSANQVAAVQTFILSELRPRESRHISARWLHDIPQVDDLDVRVDLDAEDQNILLAPSSASQYHLDADR